MVVGKTQESWKRAEQQERAAQLAIVVLTRRQDVHISRPPKQYDIDLLVTIHAAQEEDGPVFGLKIQSVTQRHLSSLQMQRLLKADLPETKMLTFPVCQLVVNVILEDIQWRWLLKPVVQDGHAILQNLVEEDFMLPLDNKEVDAIVDLVQSWHGSYEEWQVRLARGKWQVIDSSDRQIAEADEREEAALIAAAPEIRAILVDALPIVRPFAAYDPKAERAMNWAIKALCDAVGDTADVINAAPSLATALRSMMKYISAGALADQTLTPLQSRSRQALHKALG